MKDTRLVALSGVHNFRDYGDYPTSSGGRLRRGQLFRSGQHAKATDDDLGAIGAIPFATIIDLRGGSERDTYPCRRAAGFAAEVFFDERESASLPPHMQGDLAGLSEEAMLERMELTYRGLPFRPALFSMMGRYFDALAQSDGASLIHCFAGKDRTGVSVALFHTLVGVHHDDMMHDYLLTNVAADREKHMVEIGEFMRSRYGVMSQDALRVMTGVYPQWLDAAFAAINERYGSVDKFFAEGLGVDAAKRAAIEANVLAG